MTRTIDETKVGTTIETVAGTALYKCTEVEDQYGNWNDHWSTIFGEYVIHRGKYHHVYTILYNEDGTAMTEAELKEA